MLKDQPGQNYHNASYTYDLLGGLNCCACSILFGVTIPIAWLIFVSVKPPEALKDLTRTIFILCRTVAASDYVPQRERGTEICRTRCKTLPGGSVFPFLCDLLQDVPELCADLSKTRENDVYGERMLHGPDEPMLMEDHCVSAAANNQIR